MRQIILAALLATSASAALAAPTPKEQLLVPPANATHYVVISSAGKHGDEYLWTTADGRTAIRQSILLRGLIFETDEVMKFGADGMPSEIVIRGVTPSGDAAEDFRVNGAQANWTSPVDKGGAAYPGNSYYVSQGGPFVSFAPQIDRLAAAGPAGLALLPSGKATLQKISELEIDGPGGAKKKVELQLLRGTAQTPQPVWTSDGKFFGALVGLTILPQGYEANLDKMQAAQDAAIAALAPATAAKFLTADAKRPVLFKNVQIYDTPGEKFVANQNVLTENGKIVSVGAAPASLPAGTRVVDGAGKTLVPGLWDSHMHVPDDFTTVSELALGVTSCRNPGGPLELEVSQRERRAKGTLLAPECFDSVIVDQKGPLAAQGSMAVGSLEETLAAVRKIHDAGLTGVKFYTSMNPAWIPPAAKLAHELGLHVHGHIPAGMRTLDAINAGYDEITHIYFGIMQSMPDEIVAKSNTTARLTGPGRYFKDVDLDGEPMKTVIKTMVDKKISLDPTLVVVEGVLLANAGQVNPAYTAYVGTLPAATERGFKSGPIPYPDGMTRADAVASVKKMGVYVNKLRAAGATVVAGTDGFGMEIVRELELYVEGGMTPGQALATATINAARNVKADNRTGSITVGKEADLLLVDGDPSKRIGDLRHVNQVMSDGVLMDGDALRAEAGFNGRPK